MDRVHRLSSVKAFSGLSKATIYRMIAAGSFPPAHSLGARAVGWLESDLQTWIESRIQLQPEKDVVGPPQSTAGRGIKDGARPPGRPGKVPRRSRVREARATA
jgi:prophage regulatory protein